VSESADSEWSTVGNSQLAAPSAPSSTQTKWTATDYIPGRIKVDYLIIWHKRVGWKH